MNEPPAVITQMCRGNVLAVNRQVKPLYGDVIPPASIKSFTGLDPEEIPRQLDLTPSGPETSVGELIPMLPALEDRHCPFCNCYHELQKQLPGETEPAERIQYIVSRSDADPGVRNYEGVVISGQLVPAGPEGAMLVAFYLPALFRIAVKTLPTAQEVTLTVIAKAMEQDGGVEILRGTTVIPPSIAPAYFQLYGILQGFLSNTRNSPDDVHQALLALPDGAYYVEKGLVSGIIDASRRDAAAFREYLCMLMGSLFDILAIQLAAPLLAERLALPPSLFVGAEEPAEPRLEPWMMADAKLLASSLGTMTPAALAAFAAELGALPDPFRMSFAFRSQPPDDFERMAFRHCMFDFLEKNPEAMAKFSEILRGI